MTPTLSADVAVQAPVTEADRLALRNWRANAEALRRRRRPVPDPLTPAEDATWVFARDGYLTCFENAAGPEPWFAGCSVPLLAARAMLKPLDGSAGPAGFLAPTHAAQVRAVLERLKPSHSLVCIIPDLRTLRVMLHCDDFSADIARGRLWFAAGDAWTAELSDLLAANPGLPTPGRFVRMPNADAGLIERLVADAQRVLSAETARRTTAIADLRVRWTPRADATTPARACVIARSSFKLWDDASYTLWAAMNGNTAERIDPDDPAGSSPLALAAAAARCDVLVAADWSRGDAPAQLVPDGLPWVTWVTNGRVPAFKAAGPNDRLLVADPAWRDAAVGAGWPAERVGVAGWPKLWDGQPALAVARSDAREPHLAIIADTVPLDAPDTLAEYSSHTFLWEKLRRDVSRDPFALPADVVGYVRAHAAAEGIAPETIDLALFAERLVIPAYQQAFAAALLADGLPLRLYGAGWADLPSFRAHAAGPIVSRDDLREATLGATALVHVWPQPTVHAIDALGHPVVRRSGVRRETFLREARRTLSNPAAAGSVNEVPPLTAAAVLARPSWLEAVDRP